MYINVYKCKKCSNYNLYLHLYTFFYIYIHFPFPSGELLILLFSDNFFSHSILRSALYAGDKAHEFHAAEDLHALAASYNKDSSTKNKDDRCVVYSENKNVEPVEVAAAQAGQA